MRRLKKISTPQMAKRKDEDVNSGKIRHPFCFILPLHMPRWVWFELYSNYSTLYHRWEDITIFSATSNTHPYVYANLFTHSDVAFSFFFLLSLSLSLSISQRHRNSFHPSETTSPSSTVILKLKMFYCLFTEETADQ